MKRIDSFEVGTGSGMRLVEVYDAETDPPAVGLGVDSSFGQRQLAVIPLERFAQLTTAVAEHFQTREAEG